MTQIEYNSYTMDDTNGEFDMTIESGERYTFVLDFTLIGTDYSDLKDKVEDMIAAISVKHADMTVTIGDEAFFTTNQATNAGGFNLRPTCKKVNGGEGSAGLFERWQFRVEVPMPAEKQGAGNFAKGLIDIKINTTKPFSDLYMLNFTGRWKVITGGSAASTEYLAEITSMITSTYLTPYYAGRTWDILINKFDFDLTNKVLNFALNYKERAVTYTGSGGTKYILGDLNLKRNESQTIGLIDDVPNPEASTYRLHAELIGNAPPNNAGITPLISYTISGVVVFTKASVSRSEAFSLWKSEIRDWVKTQLTNQYACETDVNDSEDLSFDAEDHALSFTLNYIDITARDNIFELSVNIDTSDNERWNMADISIGEDLVGILTKRGIRSLATVAINIQTFNAPASKDLIDGMFPEEMSEKSTYGWLRLDRRKGSNLFRKNVAELDQVFWVYNEVRTYAWFDKVIKIKRTGSIKSSKVKV